MPSTQLVLVAVLLLALGGVGTVLGWRAWTGRWRGWVRMSLGHRVLPLVAVGPTVFAGGLLLVLQALGDGAPGSLGVIGPVGVVLLVLLLLGGLASVGMLVAAIFLGDRWYPRWYHRLPEGQRER